jgi:hypothetical protein
MKLPYYPDIQHVSERTDSFRVDMEHLLLPISA